MVYAEKKQTQERGVLRLQMYISIFVASLLMIIRGSILSWTSPILKKLDGTDDNPLGRIITDDESSWLASLVTVGSVIGALIFGALGQILGRKTLLTIVCVPPLLFYLTMTFSKTIWLFYIARILSGMGLGGILTLLPMYICELADPKIRGKLCVSLGIFKILGTLLTFCIGPYVPFYWYHFGYFSLSLFFGTIIFLFALESPYYFMKTDSQRAEQLLKEIRGKENVDEELNEMKLRLIKTSKGTLLDVFKSRGSRRALLIGLGLTTFSNLSGFMVIVSYSQLIFDEVGGYWSGEVQNIILGVVELIVNFFASALTDKFERRTQFSASYFGAAICHLSLGLYIVLKDQGTDMTNFKWVPLVSLSCYIIVVDFGIGLLCQAVLGEIFPVRVKSIAISLCNVNGSTIGFLVTLFFKRVKNTIGMGPTFWIFGACSLCALIFIRFVLVETRGKTLEQVQDELDGQR